MTRWFGQGQAAAPFPFRASSRRSGRKTGKRRPCQQGCPGGGNAPQTPQNADNPLCELKLKRALSTQLGDSPLTQACRTLLGPHPQEPTPAVSPCVTAFLLRAVPSF